MNTDTQVCCDNASGWRTDNTRQRKAKRQKTHVGYLAAKHVLPLEIWNQLYICAVFSDDIELVEQSSEPEGTIVVSETTRDFYLDVVSDTGESKLFN
jgi:hypothetical protein